MRLPIIFAATAALMFVGCKNSKSKVEEKQKKLEEEKAQVQTAQEEKVKAEAPPKPEPVKLDAFWEEEQNVKLLPDQPCPEGTWALFAGAAPGDNDAEKKANAAKRGELAKKLREQTYMTKLKAPTDVKLEDFDAPKGYFPLNVTGSIDCTDSFGHVTIAWTPAKPFNPGTSAAKVGAEVSQNIWQADRLDYTLPMKSMAEAKEWKEKHQFDLSTRVVFKFGKTDVDRKMFKTTKVTTKIPDGELSLGGGNEDWGAGRLIRAELLGIRVATDHEKTPLVERRASSSLS
jgi:hypothetical protein